MELVCPSCNARFDRSELKKAHGKGGFFCRGCGEHLGMYLPGRGRRFLISLAIASAVLVIFQVRSVIWFITGSILMALPVSFWIDVSSTRKSPPVLKKWRGMPKLPPPPSADRSLARWVFRRNPPQELFDRQEHGDTRDVLSGRRRG